MIWIGCIVGLIQLITRPNRQNKFDYHTSLPKIKSVLLKNKSHHLNVKSGVIK